METKRSSLFARRPKLALFVLSGVVLITGLIVSEFGLRQVMGLGNPVLYKSYPLYGYRLVPDQEVSRFNGAVIKVNNLGLRANDDWYGRVDNKILFLGDSVTYGGSYINNDELFSSVAVQHMPGIQSGNAGVNAWGIENIHGLIMGTEFLPASVYVTVVPAMVFRRGLTRLEGSYFWCYKPSFAIQELLHFFYYKQTLKRFISWQEGATRKQEKGVVQKAVRKLKAMDEFLQSKGHSHLIYITPTKAQVLGNEDKYELILEVLRESNLNVTYLLDRIMLLKLSAREAKALFHDRIHLNKEGHKLWGEIIGKDLKALVKNHNSSHFGSRK